MAYYNVNYSCGHEERKQFFGTDREKQIEREAKGICSECYQKQIEADLPALTGSEKQVAWATTIRVNFINTMKDLATKNFKSPVLTVEEVVNEFIKNHTTASYFIDNRKFSELTIKKVVMETATEMAKDRGLL
jgi:hypothetical protein